MKIKTDNNYTNMQQRHYDEQASIWSPSNRDPVVGTFDGHNLWKDYDDFLFKNIETSEKTALDFGCGPGRNIVKFCDKFKQIDGADISNVNLTNAQKWFKENNIQMTPVLYKNNGVDLKDIASDKYDVVFSTICMQHICVHEIRFSLLSEFYRVLKNGGKISIQMGFGPGHPVTVGYFENYYDAKSTNSGCDTRVDSPLELENDLLKIGFKNFEYDLRPTGPGDSHSKWIFFKAEK